MRVKDGRKASEVLKRLSPCRRHVSAWHFHQRDTRTLHLPGAMVATAGWRCGFDAVPCPELGGKADRGWPQGGEARGRAREPDFSSSWLVIPRPPPPPLQDCQYAVPEEHEDGLVLLAAALPLHWCRLHPGPARREQGGELGEHREKQRQSGIARHRQTGDSSWHGVSSVGVALHRLPFASSSCFLALQYLLGESVGLAPEALKSREGRSWLELEEEQHAQVSQPSETGMLTCYRRSALFNRQQTSTSPGTRSSTAAAGERSASFEAILRSLSSTCTYHPPHLHDDPIILA